MGLRKQVGDLRAAMAARRRVEDALRTTEALLRALAEGAPVGLGLFRMDGTLLTANRPLERMLGYDSRAELQALGTVFGVFASPEESSRALASPGTVQGGSGGALRPEGWVPPKPFGPHGQTSDEQAVTLAVFSSTAPIR